MSNRVWDAEHGWHDGPAVDNAELVESFASRKVASYDHGYDDQAAESGETATFLRGYHDGAWSTYQPNANDDRTEYDRGHAAGVAYRMARASEEGK